MNSCFKQIYQFDTSPIHSLIEASFLTLSFRPLILIFKFFKKKLNQNSSFLGVSRFSGQITRISCILAMTPCEHCPKERQRAWERENHHNSIFFYHLINIIIIYSPFNLKLRSSYLGTKKHPSFTIGIHIYISKS